MGVGALLPRIVLLFVAQLTVAPFAIAQEDDPSSSGSGFFVNADGWLVTNAHVVEDCRRVAVKGFGTANVEATDSANDLAALKVRTNRTIQSATFRAQPPRLGEDVIVLGYPLAGLLSESIKVTTGNINALAGIRDDTRYVQISAPIQAGNSGGPLVDMSGRVIGMNTGTLAKAVSDIIGQNTQNVNFSIKSSVIKDFLVTNEVSAAFNYGKQPDLKTADAAEIVAKGTVQVLCYGRPEAETEEPEIAASPVRRLDPLRSASGFDSIGFDYERVSRIDYAECKRICENDSRCVAITYNRQYNACFLKSDSMILIRNDDAVTAYRSSIATDLLISDFSIYSDVDSPGGDYKRLRGSNFLECTIACMKEFRCAAFAFVRRTKDCWLKDSVRKIGPMAGVEFGLK